MYQLDIGSKRDILGQDLVRYDSNRPYIYGVCILEARVVVSVIDGVTSADFWRGVILSVSLRLKDCVSYKPF